MTKRIATALSIAAALSLGAGSSVALAQAPSSSINETTSPVTADSSTQSAPAAPAPAAAAPAAAAPAAGAPATLSSADVSDETLQKFVASAQQVALLSQQYDRELQGVADQAAQQQVVQRANQELTQAVQANGLSVQEFNTISDAIDTDPALQARAQKFVQ